MKGWEFLLLRVRTFVATRADTCCIAYPHVSVRDAANAPSCRLVRQKPRARAGQRFHILRQTPVFADVNLKSPIHACAR